MKTNPSARRALIGLASLGVTLTPTIGLTQQAPEAILNTASFTYQAPDPESGLPTPIVGITNKLEQPLIDPFGVITGCNGELLSSYAGFSVALYEAAANGLDLGSLVDLTQTESPDAPGNGISAGLKPNVQNANPFPVGNDGRYNFLFDAAKGQTAVGRSYIMVINPGPGSGYAQRRIRIAITGQVGTNDLSYTATALDGRPLGADGVTSVNGVIDVRSAASTSLSVGVLNFSASTCDAQDVQITKSADRANAEMGDTVLYRLSIRNLSRAALNTLTTTDILPAGFRFLEKTIQAEVGGVKVPVTVTRSDRNLTIVTPDLNLPIGGVLNLIYATQLTPDAIRGNGENIASVAGKRSDNGFPVKDGPARHKLRVRSGLLSDCGTLLGRVFVDKNFDGEQQPGEPGVPNAVIILDDGNRITTDSKGLYHIANVLAGSRTAVLDQTSVPGYTLALNNKLVERNSQSRLVKLSPGGLGRMNFAVTPAAKEAAPCNCEIK
jgi:uncharacterized repeat protein (TIGR01451 family)